MEVSCEVGSFFVGNFKPCQHYSRNDARTTNYRYSNTTSVFYLPHTNAAWFVFSVASVILLVCLFVCLSVCNAPTLESLDVVSSFLVY